ncbi:MAG: prepilin-type N-terminal cleavage/methylation domain-containing protein [bacterium]
MFGYTRFKKNIGNNRKKFFRKKEGFTLLEILLVVTAISILASVAIMAINPAYQLKKVRDSQRVADIQTLANAIYQYAVDNGDIPSSIDTILRILGTDTNGCNVNCGGVAGDVTVFSSP